MSTVITFVYVLNFYGNGVQCVCPLALCFYHMLFLHHWASLVTPLIHTRPLSPSLAPLPQPDLHITGQGPQSGSHGGIGSLMHLLKAVVSDHGCQREGKAPPPTSGLPPPSSHLPPPSCCFRKRALPGRCLGRGWLLFPTSLPLPPSSCPLSIPLPPPLLLALLPTSFPPPLFPPSPHSLLLLSPSSSLPPPPSPPSLPLHL